MLDAARVGIESRAPVHVAQREFSVFMPSSNLLIGQVVLVFGIILLGTWVATQWVALHLGYQARLGAPWLTIQHVPVYFPWRLFQWWYAYEAYAPAIFNRGGLIAASSGLVGAAAAIIGSIWRGRPSRQVTTYGSARWASRAEIARAGLTGSSGVMLGTAHGAYLRHAGPEHVMAFAPTRSGKGVGLVVPTLLTWPGSATYRSVLRGTPGSQFRRGSSRPWSISTQCEPLATKRPCIAAWRENATWF